MIPKLEVKISDGQLKILTTILDSYIIDTYEFWYSASEDEDDDDSDENDDDVMSICLIIGCV